MLSATAERAAIQPIKAGTYPARCISVIDLGTSDNEYRGETKKRHQMMLVWELPTERFEGDFTGPRTLAKFYTVSLNEKANLRKDLEAWRNKSFEDGQSFDFGKLLTVPSMLSVTANSKGRNKITAVTGVPKGMEVPPMESPTTYFDLSNFDREVFDSLSEGIQKLIQKSDEWAAIQGGGDAGPQAGIEGHTATQWNEVPANNRHLGGQPPHQQVEEFEDDDLPF